MKLVTYNIRFGLGPDQRIDPGRNAKSVRDADIICLQEVERFWKRSGMSDQPDILGRHLREFYWIYFPAFDVDASERQDDGTVLNRRRQFGPMMLSRWPIRSSRLIVFPKLGTVGRFNIDLGAIECVIDTPSSGSLKVYSLHLSSVSSQERLMQIDRFLEFNRNSQVSGGAWTGDGILSDPAEIQRHMKQGWHNDEEPPSMPKETIVMGDFNSQPESDEYIRMVGGIDPSYGRVGHLDGFVDSWTMADNRSGERITWLPDPPDRAPGYGVTLDYCFVTPDLAYKVKRAWVDDAADGSDHRPYWVELDF
jgi:endonuclease/exonuclease/phosphatase family metal-dependent hydrolase